MPAQTFSEPPEHPPAKTLCFLLPSFTPSAAVQKEAANKMEKRIDTIISRAISSWGRLND
jgi:hypothetical protein